MQQNTSTTAVEETTKQNSSEQSLIEQHPIEGTPFTAVKANDIWFLALGKYRIGEPLPTKEAVIEDAKDASWYRIMTVMNVVVQEDKIITQNEYAKQMQKISDERNEQRKKFEAGN